MFEILTWWLVVQLLGLVGLPLALRLFRALPDRGYPFAKALGLLAVGYLAWLLAMLGLGSFGRPLLLLCVLAVGGLGVWLAGGPRSVATALLSFWRAQRLRVLAYEILFLGAALLVIWMRVREPAPWGTERPMDFALFNAIQRSPTFPPNDPWLAGYSINYYYFGYLLMAVVAQLHGLAPSVGYNLSLALIAGLTALGVAGLIANLIWLVDGDAQPVPPTPGAPETRPAAPARPRQRPRLSLLIFPLLGVVLVLLTGNQSGAIQVLVGDERAVALNGPQLIQALGQAAQGATTITLDTPVHTGGEFGTFSTWERRDRWQEFNWWWPSRSLWNAFPYNTSAPDEQRYNITEFPFFSFRLGDMHPHVMSLPFTLLALALALGTLVLPTPPSFGRGRQGWADLLMAGLILGSLYAINSWDLPTYLLLYGAALAALGVRQGAGAPWVGEAARRMSVVVVAAFGLFLPFYLTFRSLVGGAAPLIDLPLLGRLTSIIAPYPGERSGLHAFVIIFGLFALPLVAFVYAVYARCTMHDARLQLPKISAADETGEQPAEIELRREPAALGLLAAGQAGLLGRWAPWLAPLLLLLGLLLGFPLLALAGVATLALSLAMRPHIAPPLAFTLIVAALGCAVLFGVDLVYIRDTFEGLSARMNTVFKFYYQVWLLWGTLAPFALWWLVARTGGTLRLLGAVVALLAAVLLAGALVYPGLALRDMSRATPLGLDGRTPREQSSAGLASIDWLRRNVAPGSVVLEAADVFNAEEVLLNGAAPLCGGGYNLVGFGGVSATTGLPTVLGWSGHEDQWRGGDPPARAELGPRCAAVDTIYRSADPNVTRGLLAQYEVEYIYIGDLERQLYSPESLAKFADLGESVFDEDEVQIYRVASQNGVAP